MGIISPSLKPSLINYTLGEPARFVYNPKPVETEKKNFLNQLKT